MAIHRVTRLLGARGKSAFEIALEGGPVNPDTGHQDPPPFVGTYQEWKTALDASVAAAEDTAAHLAAAENSAADAAGAASAADTSRIAAEEAEDNASTYAAAAANAIAQAFKGELSGASVPATSAATGDTYRITAAGTSQGKTWEIGDAAIYNGTSGSWTRLPGFLVTGRKIHCDAVTGNDGNAGLTPGFPKQTLAAAVAACVAGDTLMLACGSRWNETLPSLPRGCKIRSYGQGLQPVIDGSRPVPSAAWAAHATAANVWQATVTFEQATTSPGSTADRFWPMAWVEQLTSTLRRTTRLEFYKSGANQAACIDYVSANPGTFYMHLDGSSTVDPALTPGSQFVLYVHLPDSSAPTANDQTVYHTIQKQVAQFAPDANVKGLRFQRAGNKDMLGINYSAGVTQHAHPAVFERVDIIDAAKHAFVAGGVTFIDCRVTGLPSASSEGAGYHNYRDTASKGTSRGCRFIRCYAKGFAIGYYSHGSGGGVPDHAAFDLFDCIAEDCGSACNLGTTQAINVVDGLEAINCGGAFYNQSPMRASRVRWTGRAGAINVCPIQSAADFTIEDSEFIGDNGDGNGGAFRNLSGSTINATIRRCAFINSSGTPDATGWRNINLTMADSLFHQPTNANFPVTGSVTITNSFLQLSRTTLTSLRTTYPGIAADCVSPWVKQDWSKVLDAADMIVTYGSRNVSYSGTGDILTGSFIDNWPAGRRIRVVDAYGSGLHYEGRLVSIPVSGSSGQIQVTPAPTQAFTNKALRFYTLSRMIFPPNADTATIAKDGTQISVAEPWRYTVGQTIQIGRSTASNAARPRHGTRWGARQITAISGSILTLDRPCLWTAMSTNDFVNYLPITGGTSSTGVPLPVVSVSFGFHMERGGLTANHTLVEGGVAGLTEDVGTSSLRSRTVGGSSGAAVNVNTAAAQQNYGTVRPDEGYIDAGLFGEIGDTLALTTKIEVPDYMPEFVVDPVLYGRVELARGSYLASKKIGPLGLLPSRAGRVVERILS